MATKSKKINHRNEYQRLIGELNHSMLKGYTTDNIKARMKKLQSISDESLGKLGRGKHEYHDYNSLMEKLSVGRASEQNTARVTTRGNVTRITFHRPRVSASASTSADQ